MTSLVSSEVAAPIFERFFKPDAAALSQSPDDTGLSLEHIFQRFFVSVGDVKLTPSVVIPAEVESSDSGSVVNVQEFEVVTEPKPQLIEKPKPSALSMGALKLGLSKTRSQLAGKILQLFSSKSKIDESLVEAIETQLLMSDVGVSATKKIVSTLTEDKEIPVNEDQMKEKLKSALLACLELERATAFLDSLSQKNKTKVVLVVGVNGVGKTTTIGKLALLLKSQGQSVMLAAGDTFRAAAVEQLEVWGERNQVPVISQDTGADSASVIFDALSSARAKGIDVLIADTAGRLHNKSHLMEELIKIQRVMKKLDPDAPHEVLLVVDGGTGQNALNQGRAFHQAVGLTGVVITKLDGTAKGGVLFALVDELRVPIRFIGVGEKAEDLRDFSAENFVDALLDVS